MFVAIFDRSPMVTGTDVADRRRMPPEAMKATRCSPKQLTLMPWMHVWSWISLSKRQRLGGRHH